LNQITQAKLAKRLAVSRSAIGNAAAKGKIGLTSDGLVDLEAPATREYVSSFSLHRGKARTEASSPERVAAQIARTCATYSRRLLRFKRRKAELIGAEEVATSNAAMLAALREGLALLPARVNLAASELERELEENMTRILHDAIKAAGRAHTPALPAAEEAEGSLPSLPEDIGLDEARAFVDQLAADQMDVETLREKHILRLREEVRRETAQLDTALFGNLRSWPRRVVARLAGAKATLGEARALEILEGLVAEEIARIVEWEERRSA